MTCGLIPVIYQVIEVRQLGIALFRITYSAITTHVGIVSSVHVITVLVELIPVIKGFGKNDNLCL